MDLYNVQTIPLSSDKSLREVQEKIIRGESLSPKEKMIAERDHTIKEIGNYKLKPDHCYRAVSEETYKHYLELGFIVGNVIDDEYQEYEENGQKFYNNKGVNWFLGGVSLQYGYIILECPAYKDYFIPSFDNGNRLAYDPSVKHFKSSGTKNPIPMSLITNVFDVREIQNSLKDNVSNGKSR